VEDPILAKSNLVKVSWTYSSQPEANLQLSWGKIIPKSLDAEIWSRLGFLFCSDESYHIMWIHSYSDSLSVIWNSF
jgi:hypothetical protein